MTESSALFSRTFLVASACVKWALRLVVLGWLVLGLVWSILHFVIVPRIDDLRPWLEQQASQALGVGVRIGSMQATSNGLIPSLELKAVRLLDAQNNTLVELPLVVTAVSPRSLLAGGFEQIYIDTPELDVRQALDGQLWVAGFPLPQTPTQDSPAADWLLSQTEIVVRHGTLRWRDEMRNAPLLTLANVD
ncbi:MAG: TIGR02099 family protein, partial [Comamonadaceae bacterium]